MTKTPLTNSKVLAEGAMLVLLTAVLYFINTYVVFLIWLVPIPLAVFCYRYGAKWASMCWILAAVLIGMILGPVEGLNALIMLPLIGIACGTVLRRKFSDFKSIMICFFAILLSFGISIGTTALITGVSPKEVGNEMVVMLDETSAAVREQYFEMNINEFTASDFADSFDRLIQTMKDIFVAAALLVCLAFSVLLLNFTRHILNRLKVDVNKALPFEMWAISWKYIWILAIGLLLYILGNWLGNSVVNLIGVNVLVIAYAIYLIGGISLLLYIFKEKKLSSVALGLFVAAMILTNLQYIIAALSVADGWLNIRKRMSDGKKNS